MRAMLFFISICLGLLFSSCGSRDAKEPELTVFVAASLTDAVTEAGALFQASHRVGLVYNFASSGSLARQIEASPRADLFFSASEHWMDWLEQAGCIDTGSRQTLLGNQLAIVAHTGSDYLLKKVEDLTSLSFSYLSLGDPAYVPAGKYAKLWLESIQSGSHQTLWDALEGRMAYAADVRGALIQVQGSVDCIGIVYRTDAISRPESVRIIWDVPLDEGPEIRYPVGIVRGSTQSAIASEFIEFLKSPVAREIFERHGFIPLKNPALPAIE
jgi:molybdate transport system substrate-binding protein